MRAPRAAIRVPNWFACPTSIQPCAPARGRGGQVIRDASVAYLCHPERDIEFAAPDVNLVIVGSVDPAADLVALLAGQFLQCSEIGVRVELAIFSKADPWIGCTIEAEVAFEDDAVAAEFGLARRDMVAAAREVAGSRLASRKCGYGG